MGFTGGRVLKRAARVFCVFFIALAAAVLLPGPGFAKDYGEGIPIARFIFYVLQETALGSDIDNLRNWFSHIDTMDGDAAGMAGWKHEAYAIDHTAAEDDVSALQAYVQSNGSAAGYAEALTSGGSAQGYREITADGSPHSALYEQRVTSWRDRMKDMMTGNSRAMTDIAGSQQRTENFLAGALTGEGGYTGRLETAALLEALLDDELSKLNTDVNRRLALETEIALNDQLERSDETAAYALAVGGWRTPAAGGAY